MVQDLSGVHNLRWTDFLAETGGPSFLQSRKAAYRPTGGCR